MFFSKIEHVTALAEIGTFRPDQQRPDVALAGFVNGLLEVVREGRSDEILRRVGQHDVADGVRLLEFDHLHFNLLGMCLIKGSFPLGRLARQR
ncbi:hypothetical protein [Bradyrhizobium sp. WSM2254]|uniref:hypothetical protein n=1 Tax=Bradyrhizobium sp. WSM2254 TaxID=1188263 RepID=UPI0018DE7ECA|nr:hypothetical protein [Bradyrhizobium sp. WSM2254]